MSLEPSSFTDEKFALYQRYQRDIHKEEEDKPFKTTPKGTTQRRAVTRDYEKEIDELYEGWQAAVSATQSFKPKTAAEEQ